ncbi:MAG: tail fiber domain-containing protein [Dehalococcoidia bacterium]
MGLFDIFGGGDTSGATDKAVNSLWQGNQMYNWGMNQAQDILQQYLGQATNYMQPYYNTGTAANTQQAGILGLPGFAKVDPTAYLTSTPGYQFGLSQGNQSLNASLAPQGLLGSGPQREASTKFGQNYGMNYFNTLMQQLSGLGQQGQQAGTQMGNWTQNTGAGIANLEQLMASNAQNTNATATGLNLQSANQNQQNSQANTLGWLGTGLSALLSPALGSALGGGGTSLLGQGSNWLMNMLGPMMSGAGGGGGAGISSAGLGDFSSEGLMAGLGGMFSDIRTKENIHPLMDMKPVSFDYLPEFGAPGQIGFVADDIEHLAPGMVTMGEDGYRRIHPMAIITLLVKEVRALRQDISLLQSKNEQVS